MPGIMPATMKPRIAAVRLVPLAFSNSLEAIFSRIRDPLPAVIVHPMVRTRRAMGTGWYASKPGTHVGRVAMIIVPNRIPSARATELQTRATVAARRISFGASFSAW